MNNCPHCGVATTPGSRFCTECGRPLAAAGQAPVPPASPPGMPPAPPAPPAGRPPMPPPPMGQMVPPAAQPQVRPPMGMPPAPPPGMPPAAPFGMPPAPPSQPAPAPPAPPAPQMMPPAPAPQPAAPLPPQAAPAPQPALEPLPTTQPVRLATSGDLYNDGTSVAVLVTDSQLILLPVGGTPRVEEIPGIKQAVVGDFDGDGTCELAVFTDSHVWVIRFGAFGSVHGGKAALQEVPSNLFRSPLTDDGRTVFMSIAGDKIGFYRLHPAKGLIELGTSPLPDMK